jgi:arabinogalactan oligomer / maltooligosaccharide transport system permease protein
MTLNVGAPTGTTPAPPSAPPTSGPRTRGSMGALLVKIVLLGILDAVMVYALFVLLMAGNWVWFALAAVALIALNWIYLTRRALPGKYLAPGLIFLLLFQVFVVLYTAYIAFTNYGDGHNGTKEAAVQAIVEKSLVRVEDSPAYGVTVLDQNGTLSLLVTEPDGTVSVGNETTPLQEVDDAEESGGKAVSLPGYTTLTFDQLLADQGRITGLAVPLSDDPNDGALRTADGSTAFLFQSTLLYDEAADAFTDTTTGVTYTDRGEGEFAAEDGTALTPGWTIDVGLQNFATAFGDERIREPLVGVILWTFAFAALSVLTTFALGMFLAIVFNDGRMRGRKVYRVMMILPYAFPGFLSALVWAGLLNPSFGFVNQVLLGGAEINWLSDPVLAKVSILFVNLWLGFPYMFLVCTGALQSIPDDVLEAARVDGAKPWGIFRLIKLPLVMVSMAPLLITSFAFNFNNFNLIYMLTNGGPRDIDAPVNVGATDILITLVYKAAFGTSTGRDYGLASAFAILIFIVVATVSVIAFRRTKSLEDVH